MKKYAILMVCIVACCIFKGADHEWPMFQHDLQGTGYSSSKMPQSLRVAWEYKRSEQYAIVAMVIVSEERIIAAIWPNFLLSLDENGSIQWIVNNADIGGYTTAYKGKIYFGANGSIVCYDQYTGDMLWEFNENIYAIYGSLDSSPVVVDGYVIMNVHVPAFINDPHAPENLDELARTIVCLDTDTGKKVWEFKADDFVSPPVYYNRKVYTYDGSLYCLNAETGDLLWKKEADAEGARYFLMSADGKRIVVSYKENVFCLSDSGDTIWTFDTESYLITAPALGENKLFFGLKNGFFCCVDAKKGTLLWKREIEFPVCPPVAANGKVAVGGGDTLLMLDASTGDIVETYTIESGVYSLALFDEKLVVGTFYGEILCLESEKPHLFCAGYTIGVITLVIGLSGLAVFWLYKKRGFR
jgi:outer membrane protein assembly factor BamB